MLNIILEKREPMNANLQKLTTPNKNPLTRTLNVQYQTEQFVSRLSSSNFKL